MSGKSAFRRAIQKRLAAKSDKPQLIPGLLGAYVGGQWLVKVPNRTPFCYVRVHGNNSEAIEAFNDSVSPVLSMSVVLTRDELTPSYYRVLRRDIPKYPNWNETQLGFHAIQHQFGGTGSAGRDVVWVQKQQFVPLEVRPIAATGTYQCYVDPEYYEFDGEYKFFSGSATPDFSVLRPAGVGQALFATVYLDGKTDSLKVVTGSVFSHTPWPDDFRTCIPNIESSMGIPLAGILATHEMAGVYWNQIYDIRAFLGNGGITGSAYGMAYGYGTNNQIPRWSGSSVLVNSAISDDGSKVDIGRNTNITGSLTVSQTIQPGAYPFASLPAAGISGRIARVTDRSRGLWMDQGNQWFSLNDQIFNVKEFGARGDGITDDTAVIQSVINLAVSGTVYFPTGIYLLNDSSPSMMGYCLLVTKSNIQLVLSPGATLLLKDHCLTGTNTTNLFRIGDGTGTFSNISVIGPGTIDSNAANNPSSGYINHGATIRITGPVRNIKLHNVNILNSVRDAVFIDGKSSSERASYIYIDHCSIQNPAEGIVWEKADHVFIENNEISDCREQDGIEAMSNTNGWIIRGNFVSNPNNLNSCLDIWAQTGADENGICSDNIFMATGSLGYIVNIGISNTAPIRNIVFERNTLNGGGLYAASGATGTYNLQISHNILYNGPGHGMQINPYIYGCSILGNSISGFNNDGIIIYRGVMIEGNRIFNNGRATGSFSRFGIGMADYVSGTQIHDNMIYDDQSMHTQTRPMLCTGPGNMSFLDNHCFGHVTSNQPTVSSPGQNVVVTGTLAYA